MPCGTLDSCGNLDTLSTLTPVIKTGCCQSCCSPQHMSLSHFWNDTTAYRKLPLAYPLRIARNACRKAIPSLPWLSAKAHSDGFWTNDHEMSLRRSPLLA